MCGIFYGQDDNIDYNFVIQQLYKSKYRGPDNTNIITKKYTIHNDKEIYTLDTIMGFHRLSINGVDEISNQPIILKKYQHIILMCNGEIYNYKDINKKENFDLYTNSDCEIIIHLYNKYGINKTIDMLDGVYAFVLIDKNNNEIYFTRDNIGVRPLYYIYGKNMDSGSHESKIILNSEKSKRKSNLCETDDGNSQVIKMDQQERNMKSMTLYISSDMNSLISISTKIKTKILHVLPKKCYNYNYNTKCLKIYKKNYDINNISESKLFDMIDDKNKISDILDINKYIYDKFYTKINFKNFITTDNKLKVDFTILSNVIDNICSNIRVLLFKSVYKRLLVDKNIEIACLLSGGLDSSLITSIVKILLLANKDKEIKNVNCITDKKIHQLCNKYIDVDGVKSKYHNYLSLNCFTIGMHNSTDIYYSKSVANHLHVNHYIHNIDNQHLLNNLSNTIKNISSYDTTTIRASNPNLLICDYINKHFTKNINNNDNNIKVLFSGEGSDEVVGGYLYLKNSPDLHSFKNECLNLVNNLYLFDVLRCDKCISNNNLEARVPFLDLDFINYYLSIPAILRNPKFLHCEKFLLRYSFSHLNILPFNVLWRTKEAFSDGVSSIDNSWYSIIQKHVDDIISDDEFNTYKYSYPHINLFSKEQVYFLKIFLDYFPNHTHILPFYWLPKWSNTLEPSARALNVYNNNDQTYIQ